MNNTQLFAIMCGITGFWMLFDPPRLGDFIIYTNFGFALARWWWDK